MKRRIEVITDEQLSNCINHAVEIEIWMEDELQEVCNIVDFNDKTIRISDGFYLRENVSLFLKQNYFRLIK